MVSQQKQDYIVARTAFEQALALASPLQRPLILDEIGLGYYQEKEYETALTYHKRGIALLEEGDASVVVPTVFLKLHLHCAADYRTLGAYKQAVTHYEQARRSLKETHDMKTASHLYLGLGYCSYAYTYQASTPDAALTSVQKMSSQEMERSFQQAVSFLVQSRTMYQVSGNVIGVCTARLIQAMVLLDLCKRRQQMPLIGENKPLQRNYLTYLDEAEEQCRQVFFEWYESRVQQTPPIQAGEALLAIALAFRVRISVLRATVARLSGYQSTAQREIGQATFFCQRLLSTCEAPGLLWQLAQDYAYFSTDQAVDYPPSQLRIPEQLSLLLGRRRPLPFSWREICFATGEVMEEQGRIATARQSAYECYQRADQCFQATLTAVSPSQDGPTIISDIMQDTGDMMRRYQRYISILEERIEAVPDIAEDTMRTLLVVLKEGMALHQAVTIH